jgi:hypothetical protein
MQCSTYWWTTAIFAATRRLDPAHTVQAPIQPHIGDRTDSVELEKVAIQQSRRLKMLVMGVHLSPAGVQGVGI